MPERVEVPGPAALLLVSPRMTASGRTRHLRSSPLGRDDNTRTPMGDVRT